MMPIYFADFIQGYMSRMKSVVETHDLRTTDDSFLKTFKVYSYPVKFLTNVAIIRKILPIIISSALYFLAKYPSK